MKITKITQQQRQQNRYSIYVDDTYAFSLSEQALLESKINSGMELDAEQLAGFKQLSADDKLYARALRYVAMRPRTVWEIKTYLSRKNATQALVDQTVDKLLRLGLLNDAAFAVSFARDRQELKPTSRRKLQLELKQKGISEEHIQQALAESEFNERDTLQAIIIKKRRQSKYADDTKLMQYLARQGYGYSDIKQALEGAD